MGIKFPNLCPNQRLHTSKWLDQQRYMQRTNARAGGRKKQNKKGLLSLCCLNQFELLSFFSVLIFPLSLWWHCALVWVCVCVCAVCDSHKLEGQDRWMVCRGRLVVAKGGKWKWVWCGYLLCADENMSSPAGCCSFSGQVQKTCGERDYGHTVPIVCLGGNWDLHLVLLFIGHSSGI